MSPVLSQLHRVAQIDSDQWVNFLILAIMAVLWLFGAVLKAATKKKPPDGQRGGLAQPQRETWQERLARRAQELQRALEGKSAETGEHIRQRVEERADTQKRAGAAPPGRITVRSSSGGESVLVYERAEPAADSTREQHAARQREAKDAVAAAGRKAMTSPTEPKLETLEATPKPAADELADLTLHMPEPPELGKEALAAQREDAAGYESASVIDSSDTDALRKAILHYEILGKPVGLRDPIEQSATF